MLKNYLLITFRNMLRQRMFSLINIFGLAVGLAACIVILLWVQDEFGYDRFHSKADRLYRLVVPDVSGLRLGTCPTPVGPAIKNEIPEVRQISRVYTVIGLFAVGTRKFEEKNVFYADSTFLQLFDFPLVQGAVKTALRNPESLLLTEDAARKYFGEVNAVGKMIRMDNKTDFIVEGVLANIPSNSHLQFDFLLPMSFLARTNKDLKENAWGNFNFYTYLEFNEGFDASPNNLQQIKDKINALYARNYTTFGATFDLQLLSRIHLYSDFQTDVGGHGDIKYVRIFTIVAIFILLIASINFMNLATARSANRAKEVGLRKVVGAERKQLVTQFMGESVLTTFISLLLALGIVSVLLPAFNLLSGKHLALHLFTSSIGLYLIIIALVTGLLAGSYPALLLSSMLPAKVLKGTFKAGKGAGSLRSTLVVFQFALSILLILGTLVVYNQLHYLRNTGLGFEKENVLYMPVAGDLKITWSKYSTLRSELSRHDLTKDFTVSWGLPTDYVNTTISVEWPGKATDYKPYFSVMGVDENFIKTMKLQLLSGRTFSDDPVADSANLIANETALAILGLNPETAVGRSVTLWDKKGTIIGVIKDFNFHPLRQAVEPMLLKLDRAGDYVIVRTLKGKLEETISALRSLHQKFNSDYIFSYNFLDVDLDRLYQSEQRTGIIMNVFSVLAIFISCLGLYGLAAFTAEQRIKEIGVRKVLGASVTSIVSLLGGYFIRLTFIAFVQTVPFAWYIMERWLEGFAYRIAIEIWMFVAAGAFAIIIALLTVSIQTIRAAFANPTESLRSE